MSWFHKKSELHDEKIGDGSPPAGTLVPWYSDEPCTWVGWEHREEANGFLGHPRWVQCMNGQTPIGDDLGPFAMRVTVP